jgi:hypothetical protein
MSLSSFKMIPLFLVAAVPAFTSPSYSLPNSIVSEKFDSIIVFAPVDNKTADKPIPLSFKLDGKTRPVFFAAFSPSAVQKLIAGKLTKQSPKLAKSVKFAPFSLAKFDQSVQPRLANLKNSRVLYIPDPSQESFAKSLLVDQGVAKKDASVIAETSPVVFCPQPSISVVPDSGPLKNKSFVPCSTDFQTVKSFVDKGTSESNAIKKSKVKVVALPILNFASILSNGDNNFSQIRVLPTPSSLEALEALRKRSKP